jgi:hypothetical protein
MEHKYRISFTVGGSAFDIESTDLAWLEGKEKEYLAKLSERPSQPTGSGIQVHAIGTVVAQNLTINEFYKKYIKPNKITARPDIGVFFVYFLEKVLKKDTITTVDVMQCFADVSYPNYNKLNVADILNQGRRKALLNNVNKLWSLTITGEDFVLNIITGENK